MFYTYYCPICELTEEKTHGMTETPVYHCPDCKDAIMKRVITGGCGVILNGVGWASKNTATAPKVKHMYQHDLVGNSIARDSFRPR